MDYQIQAGDVKLQIYERGNHASDVMVVFLHGGPGSGAKPLMESSYFQQLEKSVHCIYFDQRGSGLSSYDIKQGLSIDMLCGDVDAVIKDVKDRFAPVKIILWGGSFGGALACLYIERYPHNVDGVILTNPAITFTRKQSLALYKRMQEPMAKRLHIDVSDKLPEEQLNDKDFIKFIYSQLNPSNSLRHIQAMSSWFFQYDYTSALQQAELDILLVNGKEDPICCCKDTMCAIKEMHNPHITMHMLSPCGHSAFLDQKDAFLSLSMQFLQQFVV